MHSCCESLSSSSAADHSVFTHLPREPYCDAAGHCRTCMLSTNKKGIHPVDIYRHWDDMETVSDRAHRDVPWDFVQPFLESHDYYLRGKIPGSSADHAYCVSRASDSEGNPVFVKSVPVLSGTSEELHILQLLNSDVWINNPRNHTIPIRDVLFYHPDFGLHPRYKRERQPSDSRAFLVTEELEPLPRTLMNDYVPPTIEHCLEFARQCLEGLAFLHELGIAHGDISQWNILVSDSYSESLRYYIIDFGLSRHIPKPWPCEPRLLPLKPRVTHKSPEWSTTTPFNPFPHDVYSMSKSWRFKDPRWDVNKYWGRIPSFVNLVAAMEHCDPRRRPSARAALRELNRIIDSLSAEQRCLSFTDHWNYRMHKRVPTPPLSIASSSDEESGSEDLDDVLSKPSFVPPSTKSVYSYDPFNMHELRTSI